MKSPIGYSWLIEHFRLRTLRVHHESFIDASSRHTTDEDGGHHRVEVFPKSYLRDDSPIGHLVFALKYDGLELGVLRQVLAAIPEDLARAIKNKPTSKHLRQLWFLYEWFTELRLDLPDVQPLKYEPLADPARYFTLPGERSQRHAILNNLLGTPAWSPIVRKTPHLLEFSAKQLADRARGILAAYDPSLLLRAVRYLYTRETKTSFALENKEIRGQREERFVALLQHLRDFRALDPQMLVEVQNLIVEDEHRESGYRGEQNFIGRTIRGSERVYYIPPHPADVATMMRGLELLTAQLSRRVPGGASYPVPPVIAAALVAFSFVYIHPFEDGNGRLHRFLIHFMLARLGFTPNDIIFPISAAILTDRAGYDALLQAVDHTLMPNLTYDFAEDRTIRVRGNDAHLYAYLDLTPHAEALYRWTEQTIDTELVVELDFLRGYDRALRRMRLILELPDRLEDLFITFCHGNGFQLSQTKRKSYFPDLSDEQIAALEAAVASGFQRPPDEKN